MKSSYKKIFTGLFYGTTILGLLLIILNIFFDLSLIPDINKEKESLIWVLTVISKASSTVGLALILGNLTRLFTMHDEEEKENKRKEEIQEAIEKIVISKEFLKLTSEDEKKNIIATLLTPENDSLNKHSNIKEYLDEKSNKYLNFFNINFRSHMNIDVRVLRDKKIGKFKAQYKINYRIYKINEKYEPICIFSEKEHDYLNTTIKNNDGIKLCELSISDLENINGKYYYNIPEEYNKYNFLIIERKITEFGHAHWISVNWRSLTPIEGISYKVSCVDGIIKEHQIFDNEELYGTPDLSDDRKTFSVNSSRWLDPYTGVSVIVANPSNDDHFSEIKN